MIRSLNPTIDSNPVCTKSVGDLSPTDFYYYDKDGFELNVAEKKFYKAMGYPLLSCLNHVCWQKDWLVIDSSDTNLIIDHSLILQRASYSESASEQLTLLSKDVPFASYINSTRQKWGYDLALDAVDDSGAPFEVIHIEYDNLNYDMFMADLENVSEKIYNIDWVDAAKRICDLRDDWCQLRGFEQNNWKANYLLGWNKAEYTDKTI